MKNTLITSLNEESITIASSFRDISIYDEFNKSKDEKDFLGRIDRKVKGLGFDYFSFIRLDTKEDIEAQIGNYPAELPKCYSAERFYQDDMMLEYATSNEAPMFQTTMDNYVNSAPFVTERIRRNRELQKMLRSFGFYEYYNIPLEAHTGKGNVMFSIVSDQEDFAGFHQRISRNRALLHTMAGAIDYVGTKKFPNFFVGGPVNEILIRSRPLQLLTMLAKENITLSEAAVRMGVCLGTVHKHMEAAKRALGTTTLATTIYRAVCEGLIDREG